MEWTLRDFISSQSAHIAGKVIVPSFGVTDRQFLYKHRL